MSQLAHPQDSVIHHLSTLENDAEWLKSIRTSPREGTWHLQQADCRSFSAFYAGVDPWPALPWLSRTLPRKGPVLPCTKLLLHSYGSHVLSQSCPTLCNPMDNSLSGSSVHGDCPGKNTGVGCHARLQEIFPTQGSSLPRSPTLQADSFWSDPRGSHAGTQTPLPACLRPGPVCALAGGQEAQHLSSVISFPSVTAI